MNRPALLLLLSATLAYASKPPSNPADFPLVVHVTSSHSSFVYSGNNQFASSQVLETVIDGKLVELRAFRGGVLALGDYPARISPDVHAPRKDTNAYEVYQGYDLRMPDGAVIPYGVSGLGPAATNP